MKEKNKTIKTILAILVVILISLISFGGIFVKDKNKMKNLLPEYQTGIDFNGKRVFSIKPDETINKEYYDKDGNKVESSSIEEGTEDEYEIKEIPVNSQDILTKQNFDKMKEIIEKRLELLGIKEFEIRENSENGEFYISIPENKYADETISQIITKGDFKISDSNNKENILIPGSMVKEAKVGVTTQSGSPIVILNIQFDNEGTKKLREISKTYTGEIEETYEDEKSEESEETEESNKDNQSEDNNDENNQTEEKTSTDSVKKEIVLILDDEELLTTYFSEEIKNGLLQLSMGSSTTNLTNEQLQTYIKKASNLAILMQTEALPIKYVQDSNLYIQSEFDNESIRNFIIISIAIIIIAIIYAIIKYKKSGLLLMISQIGFIAALLIVIRYASVPLSITGIVSIVLSFIISYLFLLKILKLEKAEENAFHKVSLDYLTICVPALIIAVVFSFVKYIPIASFGMVMFYALMLMIIYHGIITRNLVDKSENK